MASKGTEDSFNLNFSNFDGFEMVLGTAVTTLKSSKLGGVESIKTPESIWGLGRKSSVGLGVLTAEFWVPLKYQGAGVKG